jgi:hypothetical protein
MKGKKFCLLSGGLMVLVYGDTSPGDILFIARGASVPLVIRPTSPHSRLGGFIRGRSIIEEFAFVGGAYIYGAMDGQLIPEIDRMGGEQSIRLI